MRVELVYAPDCRTYRKALQVLESVIADERLPIPVELVALGEGTPVIRINGFEVPDSSHNQEYLRNHICANWNELTLPAV